MFKNMDCCNNPYFNDYFEFVIIDSLGLKKSQWCSKSALFWGSERFKYRQNPLGLLPVVPIITKAIHIR